MLRAAGLSDGLASSDGSVLPLAGKSALWRISQEVSHDLLDLGQG